MVVYGGVTSEYRRLTSLRQHIAPEKHEHHPQKPWRRQVVGQVQVGGRQSA